MANQKITDLVKLQAVSASLSDLTVVVDVNDMSSATGETKAMELGELSKTILSTWTSSLVVKDEGTSISDHATSFDFVGNAISASVVGTNVTVTANSASLIVKNEGSSIVSNASSFDFVGNAITATAVGNNVTVTVSTGSAASGGQVSENVTQSSHGFQLGDVIRRTSGSWQLALADVDTDADALGVVSAVGGLNDFTVTYNGKVSGLSGLSDGSVYFLATSSAGAVPTRNVTITEPYLSKPIYIATSTTSAVIVNQRGLIVNSSGSSGSSSITVKNQGVLLTTSASSFNFSGSGVTASLSGTDVNVMIAGSSGVGSSIPAGTMFDWAGLIATVPSGYLFCDGASVSQSAYPTLYSAIGTCWGTGSGASTFGIPDTRNRFAVGSEADIGGSAKTTVTDGLTYTQSRGFTTHNHLGTGYTGTLGTLGVNGGFVGGIGVDNLTRAIPPFYTCTKIIKV